MHQLWRTVFDPVWPLLPGYFLPLFPDLIAPRLRLAHVLNPRPCFVHTLYKRDSHLANLRAFLKQLPKFVFGNVLAIICGGQMCLSFIQAA